jgi:AraC-like DNA-binding protein
VSPRVVGDTALAAEVGEVLEDLQRMYLRPSRAMQQLADARLRTVLALVNRDRGTGSSAGSGGTAASRRALIRPVLAYIDRHRREPVRLEQVAQIAHVSPSRIRHVFKEVTGVSFKEYVTQVRVAEAKRLLLSTDLPVAEVAQMVSYTNVSQFYKVFDRSCSMSPAQYRRYYTPTTEDGGAQVR